jgi:type I restriction enzyme, R subunit
MSNASESRVEANLKTERRFEDAIVLHLLNCGWVQGTSADFDRTLALDSHQFLKFVQDTQADLWNALSKHHGAALERAVLGALVKHLESHGTLEVLRHGFKFYGKTVRAAFFKPAHSMNPEIQGLYEKNRLIMTRQVSFDPKSENSLDMLLSLNGLPVATVELKNHLTGQNVRHAIRQYKERDHRLKLFEFRKRALVHFAVDSDEVYMTTRLSGNQTVFLPFNRGNHGGAGNPATEGDYRTAYLWREVWQRDSFLDIVGSFLHHSQQEEQKPDGKKVTREAIVFPRYHQLDAVRRLEHAARSEGPGQAYLVQHSAGSGKSNSIGWLAHRLSSLHDEQDAKVFDSVIVVTDRRVLDKQLQDTIYQFEHKQGVVRRIDHDSTQLAEALDARTPIVITTLQKFPFVTDKIGQLPERSYAVIVDEAHSSQTGESAQKLKQVLGAKAANDNVMGDDVEDDAVERMLEVMQSRGRQPNLSFFAFTATPKAKTLEIFGKRDGEGKPRPFHLYTMRQAIEEGFILDVLKNYTTYKAYYELVKTVEDDPQFDRKRASRALARFLSLHPHNIAQKTEVMIEHFRQKAQRKIGGKAKAMLVASSRLHAVRYKQAFEKYIQEHGYTDIGVLVAFSGTVKDPDVPDSEFTEAGMNRGIKERELPDRFAGDDYRVLLVANKYQTGFDQPLLHTMYVDKKLGGVQAVQTLSRLNRTCPGKEDTFVLDFVNNADEIQAAFQPFYEQTTVAESADPHQLNELQSQLDAAQVYTNSEVENLCRVWYAPKKTQSERDQAELYGYLQPAVDRFRAKEAEEQEQFRERLKAFVNLYSFLSQIMPFQDPDLERRYTFCRFLQLKLPGRHLSAPPPLDEEVSLKYYRLQQISQGDIALAAGQEASLKAPTDVGTRTAENEKASLSEIVQLLNERFGTEFTKADQLFFDQIMEDTQADEQVVQHARANGQDNFYLVVRKILEEKALDRIDQNTKIAAKCLNEKDFGEAAFRYMAERVHEAIRKAG